MQVMWPDPSSLRQEHQNDARSSAYRSQRHQLSEGLSKQEAGQNCYCETTKGKFWIFLAWFLDKEDLYCSRLKFLFNFFGS